MQLIANLLGCAWGQALRGTHLAVVCNHIRTFEPHRYFQVQKGDLGRGGQSPLGHMCVGEPSIGIAAKDFVEQKSLTPTFSLLTTRLNRNTFDPAGEELLMHQGPNTATDLVAIHA